MYNKEYLLKAIGEIKEGFYHLLDAYEEIEKSNDTKLKDFLYNDFCYLYPFSRSIDDDFSILVCFEEEIKNKLKEL